MSRLDRSADLLRVKIVLAGIPHAGKEEMLRRFAARYEEVTLREVMVGDSRVLNGRIRIPAKEEGAPRIELQLLSVVGEASYHAVTELLLDAVDGVIFVCPIMAREAEAMKENLSRVLYHLRRKERDVDQLPFALHYRPHDDLPDFQIEQLEAFLGLVPGSLPRFFTPMDGSEGLEDSLEHVLQRILDQAAEAAEAPEEEVAAGKL